jgi:chemotaxis response regulator CheB
VLTLEKRCFFVAPKDSLFKQLVAGLLLDLADDINLYESRAVDFERLMDEFLVVSPDVVLLDEASPFSKDDFLVRLLIMKPGVPVIVISHESNSIHVVRRETQLLSSSHDLINMLHQVHI